MTNLSGNDCPSCGKKGTVFRCPIRKKGKGHWDYGQEIVCYVCVYCTLGNPGTKCTPGLGKGMQDDKEFWDATPEMSWDLYELITNLYDDRQRLHQIRTALGLDQYVHQNELSGHTVMLDVRKKVAMLCEWRAKLKSGEETIPDGWAPDDPSAPAPGPTRRPPRGPPPPRLFRS